MNMGSVGEVSAALQALRLDENEEKKEESRVESNQDLAQRKKLDKMFEKISTEKLASLEIIDMPEELENVTLYEHQEQGISWLVRNEESNDLPGWYTEEEKDGKMRYRCMATRHASKRKPRPVGGSILADDMGLGKTLQAVGLILARPGCTLVVAPVSVISNWNIQFEQFASNLKVELFYGPNRTSVLSRVEDGQVDVLLTSYHQLVSEKKQMQAYYEKLEENEERQAQGRRPRHKIHPRTFIFDVPFFRVILDEAHEVRNPSTWLFQSVCALDAEHKLCLTGTPFVNRPEDIGSLLTFLGAEPLSDPERFEKYVVRPIMKRKEVGLARLRTIMAHVSLRRNKDIISSNLPEKTVHLVRVTLTEGSHKEVLDVFSETARRCIIGLFQLGCAGRRLGAIFGLLTRVRQAACDLRLVPARRRLIVEGVAEDMKEIEDLTSPEGVALLEKLVGQLNDARVEEALEVSSGSESEFDSGSEDEESVASFDSDEEVDGPKCQNCADVLNEDTAVIIRSCQHVFCEECLDPTAGQICPECKSLYSMDDLSRNLSSTTPMKSKTPVKRHHRPRFVEEEKILDFDEEDTERSPKVQALIDAIKDMEPDEKGVIFSQYTSFLDIIQDELLVEGYTYTRIDGSMNAEKRLEAMRKFSTMACDSMKTPRFVLCSLRACGTGINLTRGNWVFLCEPYWNLAVEEQAMDRVHRIGQKRDVKVIRLVMSDSVEERMVDLSLAKATLGKGTMQKITPQERKKARLTFLRDLFNIGEQDIKWDTDFISDDEADHSMLDDDEDAWI